MSASPSENPCVNRFTELASAWETLSAGWSGVFRIVGGGVELLLVHFRENLDGLLAADAELRRATSDCLKIEQEQLSVVELSMYRETVKFYHELRSGDGSAADQDPMSRQVRVALADRLEDIAEMDALSGRSYLKPRLYPTQPENMPFVCYYPMGRRRTAGQNWYALPLEERAKLMEEHARRAREYRGRIQQVIGGSTGLDDWEWAVTLWSGDPKHFKSIITDLRYDLASSQYAEFGPFLVGKRLPPDDIPSFIAPRVEPSGS